MISLVTRQQLKPVLMDAKSSGVDEPYFEITGQGNQNVTVIAPGRNGDEYNKTCGYFHSSPEVEIYNIVYGQGVIVLQRNDELGEAKEVRVQTVRGGTSVEVPAGCGHCLVNIGKTYLVAIDSYPYQAKNRNFDLVKQKKGLAYYVVEKKGEVGFEPNYNYKIHPQITTY